ncbi:ABC transporter ATP-binding protein [Pseudorhodoplanes sp.]|uniref:ABC transporter ATP-binding protein n=1 Tax=Pseudorhodoplanes sp. TaxID=1934341 RepID=UPI003D141FCD
MTQPPLLRIDQATKRFQLANTEIVAVNDVSLDVFRGETLAIVGESGSGKSTLANLILGSQAADTGAILLDGCRLEKRRPRPLRKRIALVQQNPYSSLNPRMSVRQAIELPLIVHRLGNRRERYRRVIELLELVGLPPDFAVRRPLALSGGQRQRVAIARALATSPDLLVLDEPTSSLDVSVQAHILRLLRNLQQRFDLTYIFITHDLGVVRVMASRIAVLYRGRLVEMAPVKQLFDAPRHRYTNMLLASIPTVSAEEDRLKPDWPWNEMPEAVTASAAACAFLPRCPFRTQRCANEQPKLIPDGAGQAHACFVPAPVIAASASSPSVRNVASAR